MIEWILIAWLAKRLLETMAIREMSAEEYNRLRAERALQRRAD